jgi:glycosyltransferase involved in cell wall biosynthesis
MKLLIVTQEVDSLSPTLGFFVEWLREFSRQCERVDVIALRVGSYDLPANVRVVSMGKEKGYSRLRRLFEYWRHLWKFLPECDSVFAHMCPEYVIAGWPLTSLRQKPVALWYAHKSVNLRLRLACRIARDVLTIAPGSVNVPGIIPHFLGHGIPTELFLPLPPARTPPFRFVAVGRLTPIKRLELLVAATAIVRKRGVDAELELWGAPAVPSDAAYETSLHTQANTLGISMHVHFLGPVPFGDMPMKYQAISLALNASPTGAIDKAVLEAMSCARTVVLTNRNFSEILDSDASACLASPTAEDIAAKLESLCKSDRRALEQRLRRIVVNHHGLPHLVQSAIALMTMSISRSTEA